MLLPLPLSTITECQRNLDSICRERNPICRWIEIDYWGARRGWIRGSPVIVETRDDQIIGITVLSHSSRGRRKAKRSMPVVNP